MIRGQGENLPYFWIYLLYGHIRGIFASIYHILNTSGHLFNSTVILKKCTKSKTNLSKSSLRISFISSIICVYKLNNKITCICDVCPLDRYWQFQVKHLIKNTLFSQHETFLHIKSRCLSTRRNNFHYRKWIPSYPYIIKVFPAWVCWTVYNKQCHTTIV